MATQSLSASVLIPSQFENHEIRALLIDGEPWFIAADVCVALKLSNPSMALRALDDDEKALSLIEGLSKLRGGNEQVNIINESGLYTLILRCRDAVKPGALPHRFRKKVTSEILPAIRKTGRYEAPSQDSDIEIRHSVARLDIELRADRTFTVRTTSINEYTAADMLCAMARATVEIVKRTNIRRVAP